MTRRVVYSEGPPITTKDVAEIFGVSEMTIRRWCDEGRLPYSKTYGGHRRFNRTEIDKLAAEVGVDV